MKKFPALLAATALTLTSAVAALATLKAPEPVKSSFNQIRALVFQNPIWDARYFPRYEICPRFEVQTLMGLARLPGVELVERLRATTTQATDVKEKRPKVIHAMGVCADGVWKIDAPSPATGLLAQGTEAPAILRFSTGNNVTVYKKGQPRMFGMAVKVFPSRDPDEQVATSNLFTLDQYGLDGQDRPLFMAPLEGDPTPAFQNVATAHGPAQLARGLFGRFDSDPTVRPLYPFTEVDGDGQAVPNPRTPRYIQFVPTSTPPVDGYEGDDFRNEFLGYLENQFAMDIILPAQDGVPADVRIGRLSARNFVISESCDQELHFHHHPTR